MSQAESGQPDEKAELQLIRASHLAATGQCGEAMSIAEAATSRDAATERLIGKCSIQAKQYEKALHSLRRAAKLDPSLDGVALYHAIALYHLQDYVGAKAALDNARRVGEEGALHEFYSGLLLLRDDRARESALAFERAAARSPSLVEPVASYYAALAWQSINENEPLASAADRVMDAEPGGTWALEAKSLLALQAERHRGGQTGLQRWASIKAGVAYDSNVVLLGSAVDRPDSISSKGDVVGHWSMLLGAEFLEVKGYTLGAMASYTGNAHADLVSFDQHFISLSGWADRELRPTTLARLLASVGYGWFDEASYLVNFNLTGLVEERWGRWGTTRCTLGLKVDDYRYELGPRFRSVVKQDGVDVGFGCNHELPINLFSQFEPLGYAGYEFANNFADGIEWDQASHEIKLGLRTAFPYQVDLDVSGTYTRRDFRRASAFTLPLSQAGPDREDDSFQFDLELSKEFRSQIEASVRYQYTDSGSNTPVFDYKRHVVGVYAELKFP